MCAGSKRCLQRPLLSDVCISTSAAPTYLPGHQFETKDKDGKTRPFNLIDGGVAANNPVSYPTDPAWITTKDHVARHETMHDRAKCAAVIGQYV